MRPSDEPGVCAEKNRGGPMGLWCMEQRRSERCSRRTTFSLCPTFAEFFPEPGQPLTETMALNKVAVLLAFPCIQGMISGALQGRRSLSEWRRRSSGWSSSRGPSRKERERETRNGPWESWYQEDWYDDWPDQDRWSWRNPHPRDDADEDWGPEEEEEYEDSEEEDAEERDLSADSRESYENATSESSPDLQASQEEPHPSTTGKQAMKSS